MRKYLIIYILISIASIKSYSNNDKLDSLLKVVNTTTDTVKGNALLEIADYYGEQQKYILAINYFEKSIEYIKDNRKKAITYNLMGMCYSLIGNNSLSLDYQYKALNIVKEIGGKDLLSRIYNDMGKAYCSEEKYQESINYYKKSLVISEEQNDSSMIINIKNNIGVIYNYQKKYQKSLDYLNKLMKENKNLDYYFIYNNIGFAYLNMKNYKKAEEAFLKSISLNKKGGHGIAKTYGNLAKLYLLQGNYDKAHKHYVISLNLAGQSNDNDAILKDYDGLVRLFIKTNKKDSALLYFDKLNSIRDTIYNNQYYTKIAELETNYNFKLKDQKIKKLNIEKQLTQEKFNRYILSLTLLLVLVIIFAVYLYLNNKKLKTDKFIVKQGLKLVKYEDELGDKEIEDTSEHNKNKYKTSTLSENLKTELELAISAKFRKEKLYLNNDLTVTYLAEILNTNRNTISQVINERFDKNFNNLVNEYRIKEAMRLLSNPDSKKYTIEAISTKVGFNSISVFNTAFKKVTGVTPSVFIKSIS